MSCCTEATGVLGRHIVPRVNPDTEMAILLSFIQDRIHVTARPLRDLSGTSRYTLEGPGARQRRGDPLARPLEAFSKDRQVSILRAHQPLPALSAQDMIVKIGDPLAAGVG